MMNQSPRDRLNHMVTGCWLTQMLYVAAKLEIADRLSDRPRLVSELALETGTHEPSLFRLLRALASVGVFAEEGERRFRLTDMAEYLRKDHPHSVHASVLMMGGTQYLAWSELRHSVHTGETGFQKQHGEPLFDYLSRHADEAAIFDKAMVAIHGRETAAIIAAYDFSGTKQIVDVGGGNGSQLCEILMAIPQATGLVFDLAHVAERAKVNISAAGLSDRCQAEGGSFFDTIPPGADLYLLRHIIHDWYDAESQAIFQAIREAIPAHGKLLVIESVIPPGNDPSFAKLLDITMLVVPGGKERTENEYRELLAGSGFRLNRIVPTTGGVDVIEALPV